MSVPRRRVYGSDYDDPTPTPVSAAPTAKVEIRKPNQPFRRPDREYFTGTQGQCAVVPILSLSCILELTSGNALCGCGGVVGKPKNLPLMHIGEPTGNRAPSL